MMTSAAHGSRSSRKSMITATSIISRSASGSAYLPNCDSTRSLRRQPPVHLIGDRGGREDDCRRPAVPVISPRQQHHEHRHQRESRDRQRIRQLGDRCGNCAGTHATRIVATRENPSRGANAHAAGLRQRPFPRLPEGAAWARGWSRLLGLAGDDARRGRAPDAAARSHGVRGRLSGAARCGLHGGR